MSKSQIEALEEAKRQAQAKLAEIEQLLTLAQEEHAKSSEQKASQASIEETAIIEAAQANLQAEEYETKDEEPEIKSSPTPKEGKNVKPAAKKISPKEKEKLNKVNKQESLEKKRIDTLLRSQALRKQGKFPAEEGNKVKHTSCEVFVYIVDDNKLQQKVLQEKFKTTKSFKTVKTFGAGRECLDYIKNHRYPVKSMIYVIVDYYLEPGTVAEDDGESGIGVLQLLKAYDPEIEVIILSGHNDADMAASAMHFGAVTFVQKGENDFRKIVDNLVWSIRDKEAIRKKAETKGIIKVVIIGGLLFFLLIGIMGYVLFPNVFKFF